MTASGSSVSRYGPIVHSSITRGASVLAGVRTHSRSLGPGFLRLVYRLAPAGWPLSESGALLRKPETEGCPQTRSLARDRPGLV